MKFFFSFVLGGLFWQFAEFSIHRYLGHVVKFNNLFKIEHDRHHRETNYFSPLIYKLLSAIPISATMIGIIQLFTPINLAISFTIGFVSLYLWYEFIHWALHIFPPLTSYGHFIRKHHFTHHFVNPKKNHGVTIPLFDHLFGTYLEIKQIKVPKKSAMSWLINAKNEIKPEYQKDYTF